MSWAIDQQCNKLCFRTPVTGTNTLQQLHDADQRSGVDFFFPDLFFWWGTGMFILPQVAHVLLCLVWSQFISILCFSWVSQCVITLPCVSTQILCGWATSGEMCKASQLTRLTADLAGVTCAGVGFALVCLSAGSITQLHWDPALYIQIVWARFCVLWVV